MCPLPTTKKKSLWSSFLYFKIQIKLTFESSLDIWFVIEGVINRREAGAASEDCP